MKLIDKTKFLMLVMAVFFFFGLGSNHVVATNSSTSVDSSATVQFDNVINVPDDVQVGGGNAPGNSSNGYSGGNGSTPYSQKPATSSSLNSRLPQMGDALNASIFILGIVLIVLSIRYLYYRKLLHID